MGIIYCRIRINANDALMILHDENILRKNLWYVRRNLFNFIELIFLESFIGISSASLWTITSKRWRIYNIFYLLSHYFFFYLSVPKQLMIQLMNLLISFDHWYIYLNLLNLNRICWFLGSTRYLNYCNKTLLNQIEPITINAADTLISVCIDFYVLWLIFSLLVWNTFKKRFSQLYFMQIGIWKY